MVVDYSGANGWLGGDDIHLISGNLSDKNVGAENSNFNE